MHVCILTNKYCSFPETEQVNFNYGELLACIEADIKNVLSGSGVGAQSSKFIDKP